MDGAPSVGCSAHYRPPAGPETKQEGPPGGPSMLPAELRSGQRVAQSGVAAVRVVRGPGVERHRSVLIDDDLLSTLGEDRSFSRIDEMERRPGYGHRPLDQVVCFRER